MRTEYFENRKEVLHNLNGKILDIGCNTGHIHSLIKGDVYGVDLEITNYTNNVIKADAQYLPFKNNVFDTIFAGEIIEHLLNPYLFIIEIKRTLKENGKLILTTPNMQSIDFFFKNLFGKKNISHTSHHLYGWDMNLLINLFKDSGFEIEETGYVNIYRRNIPFKIFCKIFKRFSWHIYIIVHKDEER